MSWTDLGEIVRLNQAYRPTLQGYDSGDNLMSISTDGKYLQVYFQDWLANGTQAWQGTSSPTQISIARAPLAPLLDAAFGANPHAIGFQKYSESGWNFSQALGGYSADLNGQ